MEHLLFVSLSYLPHQVFVIKHGPILGSCNEYFEGK